MKGIRLPLGAEYAGAEVEKEVWLAVAVKFSALNSAPEIVTIPSAKVPVVVKDILVPSESCKDPPLDVRDAWCVVAVEEFDKVWSDVPDDADTTFQ